MTDDPFGTSRKRLLGLAYRMLGSRAEAEDVLQDAWLRFDAVRNVDNRDALLTTIVTRLCLDRLKSARSRREAYVGPWLPEPIVDAEALAPDAATELADDLSFALLLTLERLSPAERAAFLLHDVFDMPFAQVSAVLERNEATCRQLAARARGAVRRERSGKRPSEEAHIRLMTAFGVAVASGDVDALSHLLHEDAVLISDGGGQVMTARNPIRGADRIARFFAGVARKFSSRIPGLRGELAPINGTPSVVTWYAEQVVQVLALDSDGEKITAVYVVSNPEKLRSISA
ncbi:MAG TPA: RNA polymerase sigma factor SigJ [Sphingobium sp.]